MDEYDIFQSIVEIDAAPTKPANGAQTDDSKPTGTSSAGAKPAGSNSSPVPSTGGSSAGAKPAGSTGGSNPTDVKESSINFI